MFSSVLLPQGKFAMASSPLASSTRQSVRLQGGTVGTFSALDSIMLIPSTEASRQLGTGFSSPISKSKRLGGGVSMKIDSTPVVTSRFILL